jgi:hypothetical protein
MKIRPVIRGFAGYVPGLLDLFKNRKEHTGSVSAAYCYSVWLRHFLHLRNHDISDFKNIAEIGPGASLGIGLSSIICGAENYYAFDLIEHSAIESNLKIFDELVQLFKTQTDIPSAERFPKVKPTLDLYSFKALDLKGEFFKTNLNPERVNTIRQALRDMNSNQTKSGININYMAPWYSSVVDHPVDLIISQAVLEHVDDLETAIQKMTAFLRKGGIMSHVIDYTAHETHNTWNGHWSYPPLIWKIIAKGRSYPLNRKPHSFYLKLFRENNLKIRFMQPTFRSDGIGHHAISSTISGAYEPSDMEISGCYFILQKD